ncbi:hypothetical protein V2I01_11850 [Micromonospora sp. BRA006-A]|nr:hypothetical protein [Micromonospora sp. BRA006-A]
MSAFNSPASAQAADVLQVNSAYNDSSDDLGGLFVSVTSSQPVAEIRAELVDEETGALVARSTDFVLHSETPEKTVFRTSAPLILDALGDYLVHVEVTDVAGNHVRQERAGWILYRVVTFLEDVTVNPSTVDYDNRQVTVRGCSRAAGRAPARFGRSSTSRSRSTTASSRPRPALRPTARSARRSPSTPSARKWRSLTPTPWTGRTSSTFPSSFSRSPSTPGRPESRQR